MDELKSYLEYNKDTGKFTRKISTSNRIRAGDIAGYLDKTVGYIRISVKSKTYLAHHLVWLYHHGYLPKEIDHINGIRNDNRIENLREVSRLENTRNKEMHGRNTSGVTGITYNKAGKSWRARINVNYKEIYLGCFKNKEDAILARRAAEMEFGFHPNHGRIIYNAG